MKELADPLSKMVSKALTPKEGPSTLEILGFRMELEILQEEQQVEAWTLSVNADPIERELSDGDALLLIMIAAMLRMPERLCMRQMRIDRKTRVFNSIQQFKWKAPSGSGMRVMSELLGAGSVSLEQAAQEEGTARSGIRSLARTATEQAAKRRNGKGE